MKETLRLIIVYWEDACLFGHKELSLVLPQKKLLASIWVKKTVF